jgi:hypothetical protein
MGVGAEAQRNIARQALLFFTIRGICPCICQRGSSGGWCTAWYAFARSWSARPPVLKSVLVATFVLIGVGFVGTFPLFFALLTAH